MEGTEKRRTFLPLGQRFFPNMGCCSKPVESPINIPVLNPTYYGHQIFLEPSGTMPHQKFVFASPTGRVNVGFVPQYSWAPQPMGIPAHPSAHPGLVPHSSVHSMDMAPHSGMPTHSYTTAASTLYGQLPQESLQIQPNLFDGSPVEPEVYHQETFGLARLFGTMNQVPQDTGLRGRFFSCCAPKEVDANEVGTGDLNDDQNGPVWNGHHSGHYDDHEFGAEGHELGMDTPRRKPFCNFLRQCYPRNAPPAVSRQPSVVVSKEVSIDEQGSRLLNEQGSRLLNEQGSKLLNEQGSRLLESSSGELPSCRGPSHAGSSGLAPDVQVHEENAEMSKLPSEEFMAHSSEAHVRECQCGKPAEHLETSMFGNLYSESMTSVPGFENVDTRMFNGEGVWINDAQNGHHAQNDAPLDDHNEHPFGHHSGWPSCWGGCYPRAKAAQALEPMSSRSAFSAHTSNMVSARSVASNVGCFSGCMGGAKNLRTQSTFGLRNLYRSVSSRFGLQSHGSGLEPNGSQAFAGQASLAWQGSRQPSMGFHGCPSIGSQKSRLGPSSRLVSIAQPEKSWNHRNQVQPNTFRLHAIEIHQYVPIPNMPASKFVENTNPENFGKLNTYNGLSGDQQWLFNPHTTGPVAPMMSHVINRTCRFKVPEMYELRDDGMIERMQTEISVNE